MARSAIRYNRSIIQPIVPNQPFVKQIKHWSGIYQESFFENFKTKIFLDDSWILLVIPDHKSCPLCGHVTVQWFRRRNDFCFSQELPEIVRNLSEIFFALCRIWMWRGGTLHGNNPFFDTLLVRCNQKVGSKTLPCK